MNKIRFLLVGFFLSACVNQQSSEARESEKEKLSAVSFSIVSMVADKHCAKSTCAGYQLSLAENVLNIEYRSKKIASKEFVLTPSNRKYLNRLIQAAKTNQESKAGKKAIKNCKASSFNISFDLEVKTTIGNENFSFSPACIQLPQEFNHLAQWLDNKAYERIENK